MLRSITRISTLAAGLGLAASASATTLTTGFSLVGSGDTADTHIASELSANWTLLSSSSLQVTVSFSGDPTVGTVEDLYFKDPDHILGSLSSFSYSDPTHTQFQTGASPSSLPGASSYDKDPLSARNSTDNDFCNQSHSGLCAGGTITFDIHVSSFTQTALQSDLSDGVLGLGADVIWIGSSGGEGGEGGECGDTASFVSGAPRTSITIGGGADPDPAPAPEPASLTLVGAGLAALSAARRRKRS